MGALKNKLVERESQIHRFEQWQINDKYLARDEMLKEAIDEHRAVTAQASEQE